MHSLLLLAVAAFIDIAPLGGLLPGDGGGIGGGGWDDDL